MCRRPPNGSDWVPNRATEMVLGGQNEGGLVAGSGPGEGGLGVRKVEKVGKCSKKYKLAKDKKSCIWDGCKETKLKSYSYKGSSEKFTVPVGVDKLYIELF